MGGGGPLLRLRVMPPRSARLLVLALVLVATGGVSGGRPTAVRADEATYRNLMDRAMETLREAERLFRSGRPTAREFARRARVLLEQADLQRPRDTQVALYGVQASVFEGDREKATLWLERYQSRTAYGERDPMLHFLRAFVFLYLDHSPDRALENLEKMGARRFDAAARTLEHAALMAEGRRYWEAGSYERAAELFQKAAGVGKALGDRNLEFAARANLGFTYQSAKELEKAVTVFHALAVEDPSAPLWHWYEAITLAELYDFDGAVAPYRKVIDLVEKGKVAAAYVAQMRFAYLRLGNTLRQLARKEEDADRRRELLAKAKERLMQFVELVPDAVAGHYWLGVMLYEDFGRPYEAMDEFLAAYRLDPVCDDSLAYLVRISEIHGPPPSDTEEERAAAEKAWRERQEAWRQELQSENAARKAIREERRRTSRTGTDGCK